ncbi:MAG: peptidylprolyl isomerase [Beijerinckiaceae bacterium]|nr:peptidylprolyl isomerase [Beijerinckiaceae bacterium]
MKTQFSRAALLAAGLVFLAAGPGLAEDKVLAKVNGVPITEADTKLAEEDLAGSLPPNVEGAARQRYLVDYLVDLKLLAQAAEKQKLGEGDDFARRMAYAKDRALMEKLLTGVGGAAVTDTAMKAFYDEQVKSLPVETEVRARHILVETEDAAKSALTRLKAGEDFAKLAAELSKDPGSGKEGGDLGYFTKDRMVPEFAEAAFKTEPGKISEIVKSQFGYHIIKVEDRREKKPPAFDLVKDQISKFMTQRAQEETVTKLRADAKVERFDAAPAPPPVELKKP